MKKISLIAIIFLSTFLFGSTLTKADSFKFSNYVSLNIYNDWSGGQIKAKEGYFRIMTKEQVLQPNQNVSWVMSSYNINDLSIMYMKDGVWTQIPGCSRGAYTYVNLNVYVVPNPSNPLVPICQAEFYPVVPISDNCSTYSH